MGRFEFDKRDVAYVTELLAHQLKNSQSLQEKKEILDVLQKMIRLEERYIEIEEQVGRLPVRMESVSEPEQEPEPEPEPESPSYLGVARRQLTGAIVDFGDGKEGFMPEYLVQRLQIRSGDVIRGTVTGTTPMGYTRYHYEVIERKGQEDSNRVESLGLLQAGEEGYFIRDESNQIVPIAPLDVDKQKAVVGDVITVAYYQDEPESIGVGKIIKIHDSDCPALDTGKRSEPRVIAREPERSTDEEEPDDAALYEQPEPIFDGHQILLIGGELRVRYRQLVEWMGGKMVWSPGGEKGLNRLEGMIKQSHAVVMLTALMSHSAYRIAKDVAAKHQIPVEYVHGKGIDTLDRALQKLATRVQAITTKRPKPEIVQTEKIQFSRPKPFMPEPLLTFTKDGKCVEPEKTDKEDSSEGVIEVMDHGDVLDEWIGNFNAAPVPSSPNDQGIFLYFGTSTDELNHILHEGILPSETGILKHTVELTNKWHMYQAYQRVMQRKTEIGLEEEPHLCCLGVYVPYDKLAVSETFLHSRYLERKVKSAARKGQPLVTDWTESLGQVSSVSYRGPVRPEQIVTVSILSPTIVQRAMGEHSPYLKDVQEWEKGKGKGTLKTQQVIDVFNWYEYEHLHLLKTQLFDGFQYKGVRVDEQGQVTLVDEDRLVQPINHDGLGEYRNVLTSDWFYYFASQSLLLSNF